jgi:hypothetical protein
MFKNAQTLKNRRVKYSGIGVYLLELRRSAHEIQTGFSYCFSCINRLTFLHVD